MAPKAVKIPVGASPKVEQEQVDNHQPTSDVVPEVVPCEMSSLETMETIADLKQQIEEYKDRWLRAEAEVENRRKWAERRVQDRVASERERLLRAFLTPADNLERALDSEGSSDSLRDGVALTHRELLRFLSGEGVSPMQEVIGQLFDPLYHEAVATVPSSEDEGKIVEQTQSGYLLDNRPLRPARVIVARAAAEGRR